MMFYSVPFHSTVPHSAFYILLLRKSFKQKLVTHLNLIAPRTHLLPYYCPIPHEKKTVKRKKIKHPDWIPGLYITCGPVQSSPVHGPVQSTVQVLHTPRTKWVLIGVGLNTGLWTLDWTMDWTTADFSSVRIFCDCVKCSVASSMALCTTETIQMGSPQQLEST